MGRSFLKRHIHQAQGLGMWGWPEQGEMSAPNPNPQKKKKSELEGCGTSRRKLTNQVKVNSRD